MTGLLAVRDDEFRQAVSTIQKYYIPSECHTSVKNLGTGKKHQPDTIRSDYRNCGKNFTVILNELQTITSS